MKKDMLNIALVGAGSIGQTWGSVFLEAQNVKVRYVIDINKKSAQKLASQFSGCKVETKWEDILDADDIDAVVIATPHKLLAPISKAFLTAGKHVLCEKPGAVDSVSVRENSDLAAEKELVYMIGFNHRYHAAFIEAKRRFDAGEIGKPLFVQARYGFGGRPGYEKEWRLQKDISGGGELLDQGVHMIDLSRWFLGEFTDIKGFAERMYWKGDVEDNGFALLRTADHRVASIHVSWTQWDWLHSFEIVGTGGYLIIEGLDTRYRGPEKLTVGTHDPQSGKFPEEQVIEYKEERKEDSFTRQLEAFLNAVYGENGKIPTGKDGAKTLEVVEEIYRQSS